MGHPPPAHQGSRVSKLWTDLHEAACKIGSEGFFCFGCGQGRSPEGEDHEIPRFERRETWVFFWIMAVLLCRPWRGSHIYMSYRRCPACYVYHFWNARLIGTHNLLSYQVYMGVLFWCRNCVKVGVAWGAELGSRLKQSTKDLIGINPGTASTQAAHVFPGG